MQTQFPDRLEGKRHAGKSRQGPEDETGQDRLARCRSTAPAEARRKYETVVLLDESSNPDLIPSALMN